MLFLDLDNFKFVNDSLGHRTGDELLISADRRLEACLRPGDTVARLGGDEFADLLADVAGWEEVVRVVERLMACLEEPLRADEQELFVAASIGAVVSGEAGVGDHRERCDGQRRAGPDSYPS